MTAIKREERIGGQRLILGDCLEVMPLLGKVDSVVSDPPYGVGFQGKRAKQSDGSVKHVAGGYTSGFEDTPDYVQDVAVYAVNSCIGHVRSMAITPGTRCAFLYPPPDDIGCFFSAAGTGLGRWGFSCSQPILYYGKDPFLANGKGGRANSLGQTYPNDANTSGHPCSKPLPQMIWLVNRATWLGDIVLDPFMGSGTTLVACQKLGRQGIGIEIDPDYFDIACKRVEEAARQPDLFVDKPVKPEQVGFDL
jgi:site-specific DNA-methyltransferase (adenine-specific)